MTHADCWAQVLLQAGRRCGGDGEGGEPEPSPSAHSLPGHASPPGHPPPNAAEVLGEQQALFGANNSSLVKAGVQEGLAGLFTPQNREKF